MKICVIRHGQTDWNIQGLFQGDTDVPLNEEGKRQAREAAAKLAPGDADLIFCSTLGRARETAAIINEALHCPVIYRKELIERCFGEWEGQLIEACRRLPYMETGLLYSIHEKEARYGIETAEALCGRLQGFLDEIKAFYPDRKVLLVSHGGALRALNALMEGIPEDGILPKTWMKNCELRSYEF